MIVYTPIWFHHDKIPLKVDRYRTKLSSKKTICEESEFMFLSVKTV